MQIYDLSVEAFKLQSMTVEQNDGFSCGPCMIENLVNAVKRNRSILPSTQEIRRHHIELMNQHYPDTDFYEKQRNNQISSTNLNGNIKTKLNTNVKLKLNGQLNRIEQRSCSQLEDLSYLGSMKAIAQQCIDIHLNDAQILCVKLTEIGELADKMKRDESNNTLIRNKHGYRNASAANKKNTKSAKLDFTALSYLKYLTRKREFKQQLRDTERVKDSLNVLIQKIEYISHNNKSVSNGSHDFDLGFLWKIICYYHDQDCLNKLMGCLSIVGETWFRKLKLSDRLDLNVLNLDDTNDRYALGYFFVEFGETAKEFSDFIQPENVDRENLMRGLFCGLKEFRNVPKNNPDVVRIPNNCELFQMKVIIQNVKSELQTFLSHLQAKLAKTVDLNQYDNFHEFDKPTAKLSAFEKEHEHSIKYVKEIISPIRKNNLKKRVEEIQNQISDCDKILGNKFRTNAYEVYLQEMALNESKRNKKRLLKYDNNLIYLSHVIDTEQLSSFTEEQNHLILAIKNVMHISQTDGFTTSKLSEDQKSFIKKLGKQGKLHREHKQITEYQMDILRRHTDTYLKALKDSPEISENETIDEVLRRLIFGDHEVIDTYVKAAQTRINNYVLEKRMLEKVLGELQKIQEEVNEFENEHPSIKRDEPSEPSKIDKLAIMLDDIIGEIGLLKSIRTELSEPRCDPFKLILAAKMSLGFIGSFFMNFEKNYKKKSKQKLLLEKSVLLKDIMRVVKVRHSEVMHNATHNTFDANGMIDVIENCVSPWAKDFIAMFMFVLGQAPLSIDEFSLTLKCIVCIESDNPMSRLAFESLTKLPIKSNEIYNLWSAFSIMIACNRLLKCNDVIQVYNESAKPILLKTNEPEIAAAIYFEMAMAYQNLGKFEETVNFLKLILEKMRRITDPNINTVKSKVFFHLGLAYRHSRQLSKAQKCYDEAMKHNSDGHDLNLNMQEHLEYASLEAQSGFRELSKCHNELIFALYFHIMREENPRVAIVVLRRLAIAYMEEFNVKEFEEALSLIDELFKKHRSHIIAIEGQRIVDHEIRILFVQTKYNICKAITISSEQERIKKLDEIHSALGKERFNSLPDENSEVNLDSYLLDIDILLKKPPSEIREIGSITADEMDSIVSRITLGLKRDLSMMNIVIGQQPESLTAEQNYVYKHSTYKLKCSIVYGFQQLAKIKFSQKYLDTASLLMRRAYLCESLISFLEFRRLELVRKERIEEIDIRLELFPRVEIFDGVLIQYMRQKFNSKRSENAF